MNTVMVHIADHQWTIQAMHIASSLARNTRSQLVLLHLIPVSNVALLGSDVVSKTPDLCEYDRIDDYASIAEDYGVQITLQPMQYDSQSDALVQAAEHVNAKAVFTPAFGSTPWAKARGWMLKRQLALQGRALYTLQEPVVEGEWQPAVV